MCKVFYVFRGVKNCNTGKLKTIKTEILFGNSQVEL